uniref:Uncharacterized protein n=1 Tax=Moniliophthora roreri TaxID=221103 RepID=A0A0W0FXF5_MONRR
MSSLPLSSLPPFSDEEDFQDQNINENVPQTPTGPPRKPWVHGQLVYAEGSDSGVLWTDPIIGDTPTQNYIIRKKSGQQITLSMIDLHHQSIYIFDIMDHIFNLKHKQGILQYHGFFSYLGSVTEMLNYWDSHQTPDTA